MMLSGCVDMVLSKQAVLLLIHLITHVTVLLAVTTPHIQQSLAAVVIANNRIVKWTAFSRCLLALKFVTLTVTLLFICISASVPPFRSPVSFLHCVDFAWLWHVMKIIFTVFLWNEMLVVIAELSVKSLKATPHEPTRRPIKLARPDSVS